ncbi:MAG: hypothetical protein C0502_01840 [Opitutus sp.]|nr:hypothetical protein [Opitutus sp.]
MRFPSLITLAVALLAAATPARATTVEPPADFAALVQESDFVVRARVKALHNTVETRGGREVPHTQVELEVLEVVAGTPPAQVMLRVLGGRMPDGSEFVVAGVPRFTVGDEEIFFVQGNGRQFYPVTAVMHGRYPVRFDKKLNRSYVARINQVPLAATAEIGLPLAEGKLAQLLRRQRTADDALTPAEFIAAIREVHAAKSGPGGKRAR